LWHIFQNAAKHLSHVIEEHPLFLSEFKKCVYQESSVEYFDELWNELLKKYKLENNSWLKNLYALRGHWAAIFRDSFTADMTSTQRSEGMNNVFKKQFRRKLCLSELIEECEKCAVGLRENEVDADYKSRSSNPVLSMPHLRMLKTAAQSYTRKLYSDFEEQFKEQFSFSCKLFQSEGVISTYKVTPTKFQDEAIIFFNSEDMTITCSCRKYECIGMYHISN
jgi:zinc finger SWIM domain-containing protein 3